MYKMNLILDYKEIYFRNFSNIKVITCRKQRMRISHKCYIKSILFLALQTESSESSAFFSGTYSYINSSVSRSIMRLKLLRRK